MLILIISITIAMLVSFMCSVMEAALLSINPGKLALLCKKRPRVGKICEAFKNDIEKPIAVILILNTAAHTFGAAIAGAQFDKLYGSEYIWLFSLVFTILMVQYTEILPKTLGVRFNTPVLACTARLLRWAVWAMTPMIWIVHWINRPFEAKGSPNEQASSAALEEMDALATMSRRAKQISSTQEQAIRQIPYLRERKVSALMIPLDQTIYLSTDMTKDEVLNIMRCNPHSRYPVRSKRETGSFIGTLEIRQMLGMEGEDWQKHMTSVAYIDGNETQLHIAENIRHLDSKLLIVKSEEGKPIGMVTTNDLFKKLFSPARDSTDDATTD